VTPQDASIGGSDGYFSKLLICKMISALTEAGNPAKMVHTFAIILCMLSSMNRNGQRVLFIYLHELVLHSKKGSDADLLETVKIMIKTLD
jgi:pyrrolidone-carboxylate peptidase